MNKEFIICGYKGKVEKAIYGYYISFYKKHYESVYNIAKKLEFPINRYNDILWDNVFYIFNLEKLMNGKVHYDCVFPEFEKLSDLLTFCNFLMSYDIKLHKFIDLNTLL